MAAITPVVLGRGGGVVRSAVAQANVGQTDWVAVPSGATMALWTLDLTAVAGTTPILTPSLKGLGPSADDARAISPYGTAVAGTLIAAGQFMLAVGLGVAEQANITIAKPAILVPALPPYLGLGLALDRTTLDETYTYISSVEFT